MAEPALQHRARRYSAPQLSAMHSMGLVPWVRRSPMGEKHVLLEQRALSGPLDCPVAVPVAAPERGLLDRSVRVRPRAAAQVEVLVLVEDGPLDDGATTRSDALPQQEEARLLTRMLESIGLPEGAYRLGLLSADLAFPVDGHATPASPVAGHEAPGAVNDGQTGGGQSMQWQTVEQTLEPGMRALLVLTRTVGDDGTGDTCSSLLAAHGRELPVFSVHHPEYLLQHPGSKRLAWQVLKALRATITSRVPGPATRR